MAYNKEIKSEKKSIRVSPKIVKFIESFGSEETPGFQAAFDEMMRVFSGEKAEELTKEIRCLQALSDRAREAYEEVYEPASKEIKEIQDRMFMLHYTVEKQNKLCEKYPTIEYILDGKVG